MQLTRAQARSFFPIMALCMVGVLLLACRSPQESPETQLRARIAQAQAHVQAKDLSALKDMLAQDYRDAHGNDQKRIVDLLRFYFFRHQSIHVLTRITAVNIVSAEQAQVSVSAALAGTPIPDAGALEGLRADLYRFDLGFVQREGDWQVQTATWRRALLEEFF